MSQPMPPDTVCARAHAGAEYLDGTEPGWVLRVDFETLDMGNSQACIGGQLRGDFYGFMLGTEMESTELFNLGFWQLNTEDAQQLTAAWRDEIRRRQKG